MEKVQIEKLWNVSNSLDDMIEKFVFSNENRGEDIQKIQSIQKELDKVIEYINAKYLVLQ